MAELVASHLWFAGAFQGLVTGFVVLVCSWQCFSDFLILCSNLQLLFLVLVPLQISFALLSVGWVFLFGFAVCLGLLLLLVG